MKDGMNDLDAVIRSGSRERLPLEAWPLQR
jgi:hypothetical protein